MQFTYPKNIRFACSKCGLCCGDTSNKKRRVLLLKQDAERIAVQTKRPINNFATETPGIMPYLFEMHKSVDTGMCLFLHDNQCTIYAQRPLICRFYPFELTTDENGSFMFKVTNECPAVKSSQSKTGKKLNSRFFNELLDLAHVELNRRS